jgi:hypothetical protein
MIRPLRKRHRRIFFALGVVLPVALIVGVAARRPVPVLNSLPTSLAESLQHLQEVQWNQGDLFKKEPVHVRLFREQENRGGFAIGFAAPGDFLKPDLIVYWVEGNTHVTDTLPDNARLLGGFNTSANLPLDAKSDSATGMLVLYSLANNEVVDASKPFTLPKNP